MRPRRMFAFWLTLFAIPAAAQLQPNLGRGFAADKVYDFLDLDTVNRFNGNLTLHIPVGQAYAGNGTLGAGWQRGPRYTLDV